MQKTLKEREREEQSISSGLKAAWACKPYVLLNLTFLATWLSFQILAGNLVLYLDYAADVYDQFEYDSCFSLARLEPHRTGMFHHCCLLCAVQVHSWHCDG